MTEDNNIAGAQKITSQDPESGSPEAINKSNDSRRSILDGSYTAIKYISKLSRNKFRKSDRITDIIVFVCVLFIATLIFAPVYALKPPLILLLDLIILGATGSFILVRLGILSTLSVRQAILVWDILIASLVLGVLLCLNALLFINYAAHITFNF